ncbi:MAG TPA: hypothetical protein ENN07_05285 [candidate division Zixibacteria bacterium]|nr:hypothetical protein [candidate division Zixibacteria bacterium]
MKKLWPIVVLGALFLILACGERVEIGEMVENASLVDIEEFAAEPTPFMDEAVRIRGELVFRGEVYRLQSSKGAEILLFPVGFEFSDSLISTRITVEGTAFFHEEIERPAVAVRYLKGRFPRKLREDS